MAEALARPEWCLAGCRVSSIRRPCRSRPPSKPLRSCGPEPCPAAGRIAIRHHDRPRAPARGDSRPHGGGRRSTAPSGTAVLDQVVVTAGSNQFLHLVGRHAPGPRRRRALAAPSYFVFMGTLGQSRGTAWAWRSTPTGMIPEALEQELRRLEGGRGTGPREGRSTWSPITTIRRA